MHFYTQYWLNSFQMYTYASESGELTQIISVRTFIARKIHAATIVQVAQFSTAFCFCFFSLLQQVAVVENPAHTNSESESCIVSPYLVFCLSFHSHRQLMFGKTKWAMAKRRSRFSVEERMIIFWYFTFSSRFCFRTICLSYMYGQIVVCTVGRVSSRLKPLEKCLLISPC